MSINICPKYEIVCIENSCESYYHHDCDDEQLRPFYSIWPNLDVMKEQENPVSSVGRNYIFNVLIKAISSVTLSGFTA